MTFSVPTDTAASIRLHVMSDLHLELRPPSTCDSWNRIPPNPLADLLVLAGDIGQPDDVLRFLGRWPTPVVYVLGNHEFYGSEMRTMREYVRRMTRGTSVILLDNDELEAADLEGFATWYEPRQKRLAKVRVLGSTLWTDYAHPAGDGPQDWRAFRMGEAGRHVQDHRAIRYGDGPFRPEHALEQHQMALAWLAKTLAMPFDGTTIVVTHHAPNAGSVHPRFRSSLLNCAFVSDLSADLLSQVDLWIHGHVHDSFDYQVHGCRIVANPRGYLLSSGTDEEPATLHYENPRFDSSLLITI